MHFRVSDRESLQQHDHIVVIKLLVSEPDEGHTNNTSTASGQDTDARTDVHHAALVAVYPADFSADRYEVLTSSIMSAKFNTVGWFQSGLPAQHPTVVSVYTLRQGYWTGRIMLISSHDMNHEKVT